MNETSSAPRAREILAQAKELAAEYRLHAALGYQSPVGFETAFAQDKAR